MILTLTCNPSLDLLFAADRLVWDDANRVEAPRRRPGGQGINLVRAARALGGSGIAVAPLGGKTGHELAALLAAEGTPLRSVPIEGETRIFVGVREAGTGRSLLLNPRGPTLSAAEGDAIFEAVRDELASRPVRWVACCGSLARGLPDDFYARIGRTAREHDAAFVPDCDAPPLRLAVEAGCDLLVPNVHEAARLLGRPVRGPRAAGAAARDLRARGPNLVVITLGAQGAVAADGAGTWFAHGPRFDAGSAVGAGDAALAALLLALDDGAPVPDALRSCVAAGSATLLGAGSDLVTAGAVAALLEQTTVDRIG